MPRYRELYSCGYKFAVIPMGFRRFKLLRRWPYHSGEQICLKIYAIPCWESRKDCQMLVNWELIKVSSKERITSDFEVIDRWCPDQKYSWGVISLPYLFLPYLFGKGEYALKIEVISRAGIILENKEIFIFKLHSGEVFRMMILSALAGAGTLLFLQWLIPWILSVIIAK